MTSLKLTKKILLFCCVVLIPIQDCGLQETALKGLAATPAFIPMALLISIRILEWLWRTDFVVPKVGIYIALYVAAITITYYILSDPKPLGSPLFEKTCALTLISIFLSMPIWLIDYSDEGLLRKSVNIALAITVVGMLFGDFNLFGLGSIVSNRVLHFTPITDARPRGLCAESSTFSLEIAVIGLLAAHYARSNARKLAIVGLVLTLLLISGSKGAVLTLLLCLILLLAAKGHLSGSRLLVALALCPTLCVVQTYAAVQLAQSDFLTEYTTVSTRVTMAVWALITVLHNPLGVGYSGFLSALERYLPDAIRIVAMYSPVPLNFTEVGTYLSSANNAGAKTMLFDYMVFFGVPFLAAFAVFNFRLIRILRNGASLPLTLAVLFTIVAISTYAGMPAMYEVPLVYGIALNEIRKRPNVGSITRFSLSASSWRSGRHMATTENPSGSWT